MVCFVLPGKRVSNYYQVMSSGSIPAEHPYDQTMLWCSLTSPATDDVTSDVNLLCIFWVHTATYCIGVCGTGSSFESYFSFQPLPLVALF